ncbi:RHOMBOID-like protein 5 isoform X1 [Cucurbita maxima]|uniref:RHOMBOID-like protein n=1 Tax=Cucurbita maxima TaxID=3661 RepID=A0A6J1KMF5_CUCMA|nr:RHOMBOID-like protein 5 isoform X1 [Cucurbita maxima]
MGKRSPPGDIESMSYDVRKPLSMPPPPSYYPPPPKPWFPWLVPLTFLANIAMFVFTLYENNCPAAIGGNRCLFYPELGRFSFQPFQENPLLGPSISTLKRYGALDKEAVVEHGEGWRLVSCMWLHAGVIHLLANMLSLLFIGIRLEQEFGFLKIGCLYVLSGFGGSLLSSLSINPSENPIISVGASGALFGLLGAMLSELITNWTIYSNKCAAFISLILIIALNLAVGFIPHIDNSAHIGGFVSGFLLGFILLIQPQFGYVNHKYIPAGADVKRKSKHKCYQYFLLIVALILLIFGYVSGLTRLYKTGPQVLESNTF